MSQSFKVFKARCREHLKQITVNINIDHNIKGYASQP